MRNVSILLITSCAAVLLLLKSASAQDAAAPMRRSLPTPTPEPTPVETSKPEQEPVETPTLEIPATEAPKQVAKPRTPRPSVRQKTVDESVPRRSALAVEPVRAVESRGEMARRTPLPPVTSSRTSGSPSVVSESSASTAATIRGLENRWQMAIKNHDVDMVDQLLADDLQAVSATGAKGGKSTLLRALKNDKSVYTSVRARGMTVTSAGPETAIVTGVSTETGTTADGKPFKTSRRFTDTWKQRDGRWECVESKVTP